MLANAQDNAAAVQIFPVQTQHAIVTLQLTYALLRMRFTSTRLWKCSLLPNFSENAGAILSKF